MKIWHIVTRLALCLFPLAAAVHANPIDNCQSACVQACVANSPPDSAKKCGNLCEQTCKHDVTAPQNVFNGPVTSIPVCGSSPGEQCGFFVQGTVANNDFCPGKVTFYAVCPASETTATFVIGSTGVQTNCTFGVTLPSTYSGQNGCYGLVAVTPSPLLGANPAPDPGWNTCTGAACPSP